MWCDCDVYWQRSSVHQLCTVNWSWIAKSSGRGKSFITFSCYTLISHHADQLIKSLITKWWCISGRDKRGTIRAKPISGHLATKRKRKTAMVGIQTQATPTTDLQPTTSNCATSAFLLGASNAIALSLLCHCHWLITSLASTHIPKDLYSTSSLVF